MKKALIKIPAMIAMLITLFSFYTYIESFSATEYDTWLISVMIAMFSMIFYFIDTIITIVKAAMGKDTKFNIVLAVVLVLAIPMVVIFAGDGKDYFNVIWNVYYLLMFVLEVISIKRCIKA